VHGKVLAIRCHDAPPSIRGVRQGGTNEPADRLQGGTVVEPPAHLYDSRDRVKDKVPSMSSLASQIGKVDALFIGTFHWEPA
jgi:hypothetical protein